MDATNSPWVCVCVCTHTYILYHKKNGGSLQAKWLVGFISLKNVAYFYLNLPRPFTTQLGWIIDYNWASTCYPDFVYYPASQPNIFKCFPFCPKSLPTSPNLMLLSCAESRRRVTRLLTLSVLSSWNMSGHKLRWILHEQFVLYLKMRFFYVIALLIASGLISCDELPCMLAVTSSS